jgi:hypothetical protein
VANDTPLDMAAVKGLPPGVEHQFTSPDGAAQSNGDSTHECSSCIDGRAHGLLFGSPGGDGGIVLRALLAMKAVVGIDPSPERIQSLLALYATFAKRSLYFHTDTHAIHHYDPRDQFDATKCVLAANIGCGYFKASIHMPEKIGPSEGDDLRQMAAKVWTALCWLAAEKSPVVNCVELEGDHAENDVVIVNKFEKADPDGHCFVYHPGHEEELGGQVVDLLCNEYDIGRQDEVKVKLKEICEEHWNGAIELLAPGIEHRHIA